MSLHYNQNRTANTIRSIDDITAISHTFLAFISKKIHKVIWYVKRNISILKMAKGPDQPVHDVQLNQGIHCLSENSLGW